MFKFRIFFLKLNSIAQICSIFELNYSFFDFICQRNSANGKFISFNHNTISLIRVSQI